MGKQFDFCLVEQDLEALEEELRKLSDFHIIQASSEHPHATLAAGGLRRASRQSFLVLPENLAHVQLMPVPGRSFHRVDPITCPVIEFSPCFRKGSQMRSGRLFYVSKFYEGNNYLEKPGNFLVWAKRVFAKCKRTLAYDSAADAYWGKEAARLRASSELSHISAFEDFKN